jgi:serine/threonine-protein kinase
MGQVFLAQHHRIARRAAVKVLLPELSANESVVERFFTEARATSLIRHPGIVEVLDCDVRDGQAYIVMEHLEGESVADYLERIGGLVGDTAFALAVVAQVAQAVGAAHVAGIVHRDLKPDNVFLSISNTDGRVVPKVLDFGIAKLAERGSATHTRTGAVLGTPAYMSPEQCRGGSKVVDGRSDVYSLGCILYEMLCGSPPFVRDGMGDLIVAHVSEAPEPLHARVPTISVALDALVMQMLAKAPTDRPQTMEAVAGALTDNLFALGVHAPLVEIRPRKPVVVPVLPAHFPAAMLTPSSSSSAPTPPAGSLSPVRTTPFGVGQAGHTRGLAHPE